MLVTDPITLRELGKLGELVPAGIITEVPTRDVALELEVKIEWLTLANEEVPLVVVEAVSVEGSTVATIDIDTGGSELMVVMNVIVTNPISLVRVPMVNSDAVVEVGRGRD